MSNEAAREYLLQFRGIGPKTVACTLLFALGKEVFPIDTHIFRVLRRVGILPGKITDIKAHRLMDELAPNGKFYSLHVNLIRLGRQICRPREPLCEQCPLIEYCDYGQNKI
jgi:endonuclease-3